MNESGSIVFPPNRRPRIGIVGSRRYPDLDFVRQFVQSIFRKYPTAIVVSGGAQGVDEVAEQEALRVGLGTLIVPADWDTHGRRAGPLRNTIIVERSDVIVAFWDLKSRGTVDTITKARKEKKPTFVYGPCRNLLTE